jgi:crotonobetainyl-CoA:carnitine CoA-transferase CaiB-like acyl-CoA transferase
VLAEELIGTLDRPIVCQYRTMTKPIELAGTPGRHRVPRRPLASAARRSLRHIGHSAAAIAALRENGIMR